MKNLIVTADDFGIFPSIDQGIKESILAGKVNSVAAFSNYVDSVKNVKSLINEVGDKADIGCHLTISSGKPLTIQNNDAFTKGNYFRPLHKLRLGAIEKQSNVLEKELKAQVEVFLDAGIKVTNISCHHSTLTTTKELFKIYLNVSEHFNLPMRSVNITPKKADVAFRNFLRFTLFNKVSISKLNEIARFGMEISDFLKMNKPNMRTPEVVESSHYGPWLNIWKIGLHEKVKRKHNNLNKFLNEFITMEYKYAELMLHLRKEDDLLKKKDEEIDYPGINKNYFDSRQAEFHSINTFDFDRYSEKIKFAMWENV